MKNNVIHVERLFSDEGRSLNFEDRLIVKIEATGLQIMLNG